MHRSTIRIIAGFAFAFSLMTANAGEFAGKYHGTNLSVEVEAGANGACLGVIHQGAHSFPLKARLDNGKLRGVFNSQGTEFPFTASLTGDILTLMSGDATYTLQRQVPTAVNPLGAPFARSSVPSNPLAAPPIPPSPSPNPLAAAGERAGTPNPGASTNSEPVSAPSSDELNVGTTAFVDYEGAQDWPIGKGSQVIKDYGVPIHINLPIRSYQVLGRICENSVGGVSAIGHMVSRTLGRETVRMKSCAIQAKLHKADAVLVTDDPSVLKAFGLSKQQLQDSAPLLQYRDKIVLAIKFGGSAHPALSPPNGEPDP